MDTSITDNLPVVFGLIGVVVIIAALLSGLVEKSKFPQILLFLAIGGVIGPAGIGLYEVGLDSQLLRMIATLSLAMVLFIDGLTIDRFEVKKHFGLASLILGPGTLVVAGLITVAGLSLLGLPWPLAAILGAALASTDPVMLRGFLKRSDVPSAARVGLRLESSLNDFVLLPIILVAMEFALIGPGENVPIAKILFNMLLVGPAVGALVAWIGIKALAECRKRSGMRRDYESLYGIGIALAAFAAAEAFHSSGFLAVFVAGIFISILDVELCDCFKEYGETTTEVFLLFTFVLLGSSLIWIGLSQITWTIVLFVFLALLARPVVLALVLWRLKTERHAKRIIVWFGPRALSTLLLVLVPVFAKVPQSSALFHISTVLVLVSVALHGSSIMLSGKRAGDAKEAARDVPPETESVAVGIPTALLIQNEISIEALTEKWNSDSRPLLVDARSDAGFGMSGSNFYNSVRLNPMFVRRDAETAKIPKETILIVFCACPNDRTARTVAEELRALGFLNVAVLIGGFEALEAANYGTLPK